MNKKDTRLFNPVRVKRGIKLKNVLLGFAAFILVFFVAASAYISKNGTTSTNKIIKKAGELFEFVSFSDKESKANAEALKNANENILLMSISSAETQELGKKEIYFIVLAHADAASGQIKFCPLHVKPNYTVLYESGGAEAVTKAVAKDYKVDVTKYISSNENTFALAINYMGGLQYNVPERVEYRTPDLTLILTPGEQTIKGEVLIKYLKYFKEKDLSKQGELFRVMINNYMTKANYDKAMDIYKAVLKNLSGNSNISFVETADNLKYVKTIVDSKNKAVTVASVKEF